MRGTGPPPGPCLRIVGGRWRGTALAAVGKGDPAAHLRPTSDRVRESLFNILTQGRHGDLVTGARVLDLFAGTGALGLEALSRGAASATFVESGRPALSLLDSNLARLRVEARVLRADACRLPAASEPATLIFLDPPYGQALGEKALASVQAQGWSSPGTAAAWEESSETTPPPGWDRLDARRYGGTWITLIRRS